MSKNIVIGDGILDIYIDVEVTRISPEAPIPIGKVISKNYKLGGAANVAANIQSMVGNVKLLTIIGNDEMGLVFKNLCMEKNIEIIPYVIDSHPTITKTRFISGSHQLIRIDEEDTGYKEGWIEFVKDNLSYEDINSKYTIISDYAKGAVDSRGYLIEYLNSMNAKCVVDPKGSDLEKYKGSYLIKPNGKEYQILFGLNSEEIELDPSKVQTFLKKYNIDNLLVTLGKDGMIIYDPNNNEIERMSSEAKQVFDVTGAGDVVLASLSSCLIEGIELSLASRVGCELASKSIGIIGSCIVSESDYKNSKDKFLNF